MAGASASRQICDKLVLIGVPTDEGSGMPGARRGPAALQCAGIGRALQDIGWQVIDWGEIVPEQDNAAKIILSRGRANNVKGVARFAREIATATSGVLAAGHRAVLLGGDHTVAMGSIGAAARHWSGQGRPLFVLWLDAHADFNSPLTTRTGNLHGMVLAMLCGVFGTPAMFNIPVFPPIDPRNLLLVGTRSIDAMEGLLMRDNNLNVVRAGDVGSARLDGALQKLLDDVHSANGVLHVSLDLDVLDPAAAPGVATPVVGGCALDDVMEVMTRLAGEDCVHSLDVVEFVPEADVEGRTAAAAVALTVALFDKGDLYRTAAAPRETMEVESG